MKRPSIAAGRLGKLVKHIPVRVKIHSRILNLKACKGAEDTFIQKKKKGAQDTI